jgi:hypothetical protein
VDAELSRLSVSHLSLCVPRPSVPHLSICVLWARSQVRVLAQVTEEDAAEAKRQALDMVRAQKEAEAAAAAEAAAEARQGQGWASEG